MCKFHRKPPGRKNGFPPPEAGKNLKTARSTENKESCKQQLKMRHGSPKCLKISSTCRGVRSRCLFTNPVSAKASVSSLLSLIQRLSCTDAL